MLNTLDRIEQPELVNTPKKALDGTVFPIQKTATQRFTSIKERTPEEIIQDTENLRVQEEICKKNTKALKMLTEVLADPSNIGKAERIEKIANRMTPFALTQLMQEAETRN